MKPAPFEYFRPRTLPEAVEALRSGNGMARILSGGQSLVPMLNLRLAPAETIIDVARLPELRAVGEGADAIGYGAAITHAEFEDRKVPDGSNGLLPHVASRIAYRAVRNRGTMGGSLALADPGADWVPVLVALEATVIVLGPGGERSIPAEDFVLGPYWTALAEDEVLTRISVPRRPASERWGHYKFARKTGEYASSIGVVLFDPDRRRARAVLGSVDGAPIVLPRLADALARGENAPAALTDLAREDIAASERGFDEFKRKVHETTIVRAARQAVGS